MPQPTVGGGEGSSASVPIVAVVSDSVSSEDRRSSLSASIWSIWSWDMLFGWDVEEEEEEFCFQIGFSIGIYSWDFVSCVVLIPVNTQVIVKNLPDLSIDCWLFGYFCQKNFHRENIPPASNMATGRLWLPIYCLLFVIHLD